jgi:hypothetical protein
VRDRAHRIALASALLGTPRVGEKDERMSNANEPRAAAASNTPRAHAMRHGVDLRRVLDEAKSMGERLGTRMSSRPYIVLGAVAGVSFLAGGLLATRIGQLAVAGALGHALTRMFPGLDPREMGRKIAENL